MYDWCSMYGCSSMCMGVFYIRGGCMFCVALPAWAFLVNLNPSDIWHWPFLCDTSIFSIMFVCGMSSCVYFRLFIYLYMFVFLSWCCLFSYVFCMWYFQHDSNLNLSRLRDTTKSILKRDKLHLIPENLSVSQ